MSAARHELGYHDQMHMVRDFREFADSAPSAVAPELDLFVNAEISGT